MTAEYWDERYRRGGRSGSASTPAGLGFRYVWRADQVRQVVAAFGVTSILDVGSGDGIQAALLPGPDDGVAYLGVDYSSEAVVRATLQAPGRAFRLLDPLAPPTPRDLHLSFEVIYHQVAVDDFGRHLDLVFSARKVAMVFASDRDEKGAAHVLHRHWTPHVPDGWVLVDDERSDGVTEGQTLTVWKREAVRA
jgi:SAM-dependent methyltransferase